MGPVCPGTVKLAEGGSPRVKSPAPQGVEGDAHVRAVRLAESVAGDRSSLPGSPHQWC